MAGIVATLKPYDDVRTFRKPVDNLALALVTPLRTDHDHVRHQTLPVTGGLSRAPAQTRASIMLCFLESDPVVAGDWAFYVTNQTPPGYFRS
jgi:hypothetical protein